MTPARCRYVFTKLTGEIIMAAKRKASAAFMKPVQPNEKLAVVVGSKPLPRTELTKKLWVYIKKNGLQDAKVRTQINADVALQAVFSRSEEHTSELQSRENLVCRLLLEKKN